MHITNCDHTALQAQADESLRKVNRLEIAVAALTERLDALEGRHASLSASVRGRLGGRPNPRTGLGNFAMPLPINQRD